MCGIIQEGIPYMKILRLSFFSFLFSAIALILSDQVLYRLWLVPQLSSLHHVPSYYFLLVFLPMVLVIIVFGLMLSSWKQVCLVAFIVALSHQIYDYMSIVLESPGYLISYALENPYNFWLLRSFLMLCLYMAAFSIVWYSKVVFLKTIAHLTSRPFLKIQRTVPSLRGNHGEAAAGINENKNKNEGRMPARTTYHVVPNPSGWLVKKGRAKKASSAHSTKEEALRAASDVAKSHPLSQIVVHKASGVIESDRTFEYRHYKKKKKKKEISRKIKKGLKRNKRKEGEQRLRRRKAAHLGIARAKRERYRRSLTAKKRARTRKRK
jgi:hypothetical protein